MLDCVREHITGSSCAQGRQNLISGIDWGCFLKLVQRHRVVPHVCAALINSSPSDMPNSVVKRLSKLQLTIARKNMRLVGELRQILSDLGEQDVQAIPFKGPILAIDLYGGLYRRQFIDLDLLIRPEDLAPTLAVLQRRGYTHANRAVENLSGDRLKQFLKRFKSHTVLDSKSTYSIDVHWRLSEDATLFAIPYDELFTTDSHCDIGGTIVPTMSTEQAVPYHAFHACKHGCTRLSWLCDFAHYAKRIPDDGWNQLLDSQPRQTARMVVAAMMMLENLSLTDSLDDRIDGMDGWRRKLGHATAMMMRALCSDNERAINGTNVGLLRWKLSGNPRYFVDGLFRAVLPKQDDLVEAGLLKPHFSRWNYLIKRGAKVITGRPPESGQ